MQDIPVDAEVDTPELIASRLLPQATRPDAVNNP